jgi:ribulose-phosphate 3-epimerase
MDVRILPSLLAADFGCLADECRRAEAAGGDELHLDIMDGHFVPNLSFGSDVVAMARRVVRLPLNVHLMMEQPDRYVDRFVDAGASTVLIHVEAACPVPDVLAAIRRRGVRCGVTLKPATPAAAVAPLLGLVDEVLVMTVEPGYGGQSFMTGMLPKLAEIRRAANARGCRELTLMVDGGIDAATAARCAAQGANAFVAGSSLFRLADMGAGVRAMRAAASASLQTEP